MNIVRYSEGGVVTTLARLQKYMGNRKALLPWAMVFSGLSAVLGMIPFILIWLIVRELFKFQGELNTALIAKYAWIALASSITFLIFPIVLLLKKPKGNLIIFFIAFRLNSVSTLKAARCEKERAP